MTRLLLTNTIITNTITVIIILIIIKRNDSHLKLIDDQIVAVQLQTLVPPHHHVASGEYSWTLVMIMVMVMMVMVMIVKRKRRRRKRRLHICGVNGAKIAPPAST